MYYCRGGFHLDVCLPPSNREQPAPFQEAGNSELYFVVFYPVENPKLACYPRGCLALFKAAS
jgi:hypothetical protein